MIFKYSLICLIFMFCTNYCKGQNKASRKLERLKYDSVKVFYFNYKSKVDFFALGRLNDDRLIDKDQKWALSLYDLGKNLSNEDIKHLYSSIKNINNDHSDFDPVGCYEPRMGIAFYYKGKVNAHIDVCFECRNMRIEIFSYYKEFSKFSSLIGDNTYKYLEALCIKYSLPSCK